MPLSKKDRETLHSAKCEIEKPVALLQRYIVKMSLTKGELVALQNALNSWDTLVGQDVRAYLNNALTREGIEL